MEASSSNRWLEGLVAGLIGYIAVVIFVGAVDLALGRSLFYTPATLGRPLVAEPAPLGTIDPGAVLAYNGLHMLVFLVIGLVVAALARFVELHPAFWFAAYFACLAAFFVAVMTITAADPGGEAVSWWTILGATIVAAAAMGAFIHSRHPRLWQEMKRSSEEDALA